MRAWLVLAVGVMVAGAAPRVSRDQIAHAQVHAITTEAVAIKAFIARNPSAAAFRELCRAEAKQAYRRTYPPAQIAYDDLSRFHTLADLKYAASARVEYMSGYQIRCMKDATR